jgi:CheY-like chemotaxis protein
VDDNVRVREAVAETLASEGYDLLLARDGDDALKSVDRLRLCAVVTDFNMPHMDGDELVARLRQRLPNLPAVIMTGNPEAQRLIRWLRAAYLPKPFSTTELLHAIDAATHMPRSPRPVHLGYVPAEHRPA